MSNTNIILKAAAVIAAGIVLAGCGMLGSGGGFNGGAQPSAAQTGTANVLQVGDLVRLDFSGPPVTIAPHEEHVKDDGTISPAMIGPVKAAGKTPGQLQKEIQDLYVPRFYKYLTVTVRAGERFYFVGGEVRSPSRQIYMGSVTVTGAIKSAGDFTDFANKRKVQLMRANGTSHIVDCIKALENPELDLPVYPGDRINIPRGLW